MRTTETALVIMVPEVEELVRPFRHLYDPSAADGMPAHISLVYPFLNIEEMSAIKLTSLTRIFREHEPFGFSLTKTARFPGVLYLEPEPSRAFKSMILEICEYAPQTLPYGGKHTDLIPHLTIAHIEDEAELDQVAGDFEKQIAPKLPVHSMVSEVLLMENCTGSWKKYASFTMGFVPLDL